MSERLDRALRSLMGLSVGDAFGQQFFGPPGVVWGWIVDRYEPPAPWPWTDDTAMAISIVRILRDSGEIQPDHLAHAFAREHSEDPARGYGRGAEEVLGQIRRGVPWRQAAAEVFGGMGSWGNGGAMRAAPVGAFFAGDVEAVVEQAAKSAQVTHAHPEGQAGAIAVALATMWACTPVQSNSLLEFAWTHTPPGATRDGLSKALELPLTLTPGAAAQILGNGSEVTAADTVPFSLWCAARHSDNFEEALWATVSALGDRDTTCAIVGGIVALSAPEVPERWITAREPFRL